MLRLPIYLLRFFTHSKNVALLHWRLFKTYLKLLCLLVSTSVSFQGQTWLISLLSKNIFHFLDSLYVKEFLTYKNVFIFIHTVYSVVEILDSIIFLWWVLLSLFYQVVFFRRLNLNSFSCTSSIPCSELWSQASVPSESVVCMCNSGFSKRWQNRV